MLKQKGWECAFESMTLSFHYHNVAIWLRTMILSMFEEPKEVFGSKLCVKCLPNLFRLLNTHNTSMLHLQIHYEKLRPTVNKKSLKQ